MAGEMRLTRKMSEARLTWERTEIGLTRKLPEVGLAGEKTEMGLLSEIRRHLLTWLAA